MIAIEFHEKNIGVKISEDLLKQNVICIPCGAHGQSLSSPALNIGKFITNCNITYKTMFREIGINNGKVFCAQSRGTKNKRYLG